MQFQCAECASPTHNGNTLVVCNGKWKWLGEKKSFKKYKDFMR